MNERLEKINIHDVKEITQNCRFSSRIYQMIRKAKQQNNDLFYDILLCNYHK